MSQQLQDVSEVLSTRDSKYIDEYYQEDRPFLIEGMASKKEELASAFIAQIEKRQIPTLAMGYGQLIIEKKARDYYVLTRSLGEGDAIAVMVIRFDTQGSDLFVEWRHYELGQKQGWVYKLIWGTIGFLLIFPFGVGIITLIWGLAILDDVFRGRYVKLAEFQKQDSWAFKEAVDTALREAIRIVK